MVYVGSGHQPYSSEMSPSSGFEPRVLLTSLRGEIEWMN